jgi:hypothetical protein
MNIVVNATNEKLVKKISKCQTGKEKINDRKKKEKAMSLCLDIAFVTFTQISLILHSSLISVLMGTPSSSSLELELALSSSL